MNPAEALGKMQRAKKGVAVGSYLEGGRIMYKHGGPGPHDPPDKNKLTTGESIVNDGYKKIFGYLANKSKQGWKEFKNYARSNANPVKPTESVFRKLYGQDKNKNTRSS